MSPILLSRSYRLTVRHKLAAQTLQCMYWDADGTGSDRDRTHMNTARRPVCVVRVVMCPAVFMIVFRNARVMFMSVRRRGRRALPA